ncbi:MAG: hypothetical protein IT320_21740 [Anaerolineae bacterium]|nr:hypothetical protein [Anaerolineae bacterium]
MRHLRWLCFGLPFMMMAFLGRAGGFWLITDDQHTLASRMTFDSTTVVVGGELTLEQDSTLNGDLLMLGGDVRVAGTITHNLIVLGGSVQLEDRACVGGDLRIAGGTLREPVGASGERIIAGLGRALLPPLPFHTAAPLLDLLLSFCQVALIVAFAIGLLSRCICRALDNRNERRQEPLYESI